MMKKILYLGNIYHAEASLGAAVRASDEYDIHFVYVPRVLQNVPSIQNFPKIFSSSPASTREQVDRIIDRYTPDIIITRCWTLFAGMNVPGPFWQMECNPKKNPSTPDVLVLPHNGATMHMAVNPEQLQLYKNKLNIPVVYMPRGISDQWEKPRPKTQGVMATGTSTHPRKIASYNLLVKPLCAALPNQTLNIYNNHGANKTPWAAQNLRPCFQGEQGPRITAEHKIYISPVTARYDRGNLSYKILQALGCRTLTVIHHYQGVEKTLGKNAENLVYADSEKEVVDKVRYYLDHETEREEIAQRGYEFVHKNYNWIDHLNRVFGK